MMDEPRHFSVLLNECIENLNIKPDGVYLDGTLGLGGHSYQIASRLSTGRLICIDRDETAIERAGKRLAAFGDKMKDRGRSLCLHTEKRKGKNQKRENEKHYA